MSAPVWSQIDAGVALALGAILITAAIRKLQRLRVFALTLERLEPALVGHRDRAVRLALAIAGYELVVGAGVIGFRGTAGFVFACAQLVACAGFLAALGRAMQRSVPCACFGRIGRTAAGGREIGRGVVLVVGAAFVAIHRAVTAHAGYGFGGVAAIAVAGIAVAIVIGRQVGGAVRPGTEISAGPGSLAAAVREIAGYDSDIYTA